MNTYKPGLVLVLTLLSLLAGCATVLSGTTQVVHVQAVDANTHQLVEGAVCTVTDGKGGIYIPTSNPGSIVLTKGRGALNAVCRKKGWRQTAVGVGQNFNAWTIVNVLWLPGIIVDAITGSIQKYPSHITVLMTK